MVSVPLSLHNGCTNENHQAKIKYFSKNVEATSPIHMPYIYLKFTYYEGMLFLLK